MFRKYLFCASYYFIQLATFIVNDREMTITGLLIVILKNGSIRIIIKGARFKTFFSNDNSQINFELILY